MPRVLIVAYGNPLRSDDAVAWRAADALLRKFPESDVQIVCLHQLGPELAETISHFKSVIFIDAAAPQQGQGEPGEIRFEELSSDRADKARFSHVVSPHTIVALAKTLYGASVKAILATVTGAKFDHGDSLSPAVSAALPSLISRIETLVQAVFSADSPPSHPPKP